MSLTRLALATLSTLPFLTACDGGTGGKAASFSITFTEVDPTDPENKTDHTFTGRADCKLDTSSPDGSPDRGKFYVGAVGENAAGATLVLTIRFTELSEAPTAGRYTIGEGLRVTASVTNPAGDRLGGLSASGSVTVSGTPPGIKVDLDPSLTPLSGTLSCAD